MKERFKHLTQDRIVRISFLLSLVLLILTFAYAALLYRFLPPLIPIYNQLAWGPGRLDEKIMLFLPVVIETVILFINIIFSQYIYQKMPLVVRMVSITTLFISFIVCIFVIRTTLLMI